ncbi:hypothetical protein PF005_g14019 [Phytophthora fragariae]|uniref:Uncharacterized protein n=1 Tax=Phytophthora fragariae TaxID=53985 RepID=A0A6A3XTS6_9STRA|nr:hypothetical protein PF009_g15599 [Phytophthora fragariae]KAE9004298.1 hypothetical protein PF011_g12503 [Phytophthora fragariae]KAE9102954.1 hypothetical protein PF010_g13928 [Phytophthora fragariae]KAE9104355.1 hypothetical protein PF007_g14089 [Phytophthora fragariae]KAE9141266.1 hypothetical protein PF006_g13269 [Phytophthora fragariae]
MTRLAQARDPLSRRTLAAAEFSRLVAGEGLNRPKHEPSDRNLNGKIKLDRALQIKDRCDRELQALCESKHRRYRTLFTLDGHDELILLEQDKSNESMIRDKRELERLMRKLSPAMSHFASTQTEFVHLLQGCSVCSNRLAFCAACAEKASEFFNGFTSAELFALYGSDLPPANETELVNFVDAVATREARAIRNEYADV